MRIGLAVLFLLFSQTVMAGADRSAYTDVGCKMVAMATAPAATPMPSMDPMAPMMMAPAPMAAPAPSFAQVCWVKHVKMNQMKNAKVNRWRMTWTIQFTVKDAAGNVIWVSPEENGSDMGVMVRGQTVMHKSQAFTVEYDGTCVKSTYSTSFDTMKNSTSGGFSEFNYCS